MKKVILMLCLFLASTQLKAQHRTKAYVSYYSGDSISTIDGSTRTFGNPVFVNYTFALELQSMPGDSTIFIVDSYNSVLLLQNTINDVTVKGKSMPYPYTIYGLKFDKSHENLYMNYTYEFLKLDTATLTVVDSFKYREFPGYYTDVDFDFLNDSIVLYKGQKKIVKYNLNTRQNIDSTFISYTYDFKLIDNKLYLSRGDTLFVFNTDLMEVTDTLITPSNAVLNHSVLYSNKLYYNGFINGNPNRYFIETFDLTTNSFDASIELEYVSNPFLSPDGEIWMTDFDNQRVVIYSIEKKEIIDEILLKSYPRSIAFGKGINHKSSIGAINGLTALKLYPNPADNKITLETSYNEVESYTIINSLGKPVMSFESTGTETKIDISALPPGVYFMIPDSDKTQALKFIKQ